LCIIKTEEERGGEREVLKTERERGGGERGVKDRKGKRRRRERC
jgi:hypothetical protein